MSPSIHGLFSAADTVIESDGPGLLGDSLLTLRTRLGLNELTAFDQVLWMDDSIFGPIGTLVDLPEPCGDSSTLDAWTMVPGDRGDGEERCPLPWLVLRGSLLERGEFWSEVRTAAEVGPSLGAAVFIDFVDALVRQGIRVGSVFERQSDREVYLLRDSLPRYLSEGMPFVPWKALTLSPLVADRWGIVPRDTFDYVVARGYRESAIWDFLLASMAPRDWYTNLAMAEVLSSEASGVQETRLRTAVVIHCFYTDMLSELLDCAAKVPGERILIVTTNTAEKRAAINEHVIADGRFDDFDIRVVSSNRGRDISAFLIDCADILRDPSVDLIAKIHSKKSEQDPGSVSAWFRRHLFDNIFGSAEYTRNVWRLFDDEPLLGMVFPPTIHMGVPTLGHAWSANKEPALGIAQRLGIARIPFDARTPLSPYGSMFVARRSAIEPILNAGFIVEEFPDGAEYRDGSLAHVLERLISYIAFSGGFYAKTVQTQHLAAQSGAMLEYKLQAVSQYLPAHVVDQVRVFEGKGERRPLINAAIQHVRQIIYSRSPRVAEAISRNLLKLRSRGSR